jgi:gamma-glutamyl phosphate reductase
MKRLIIASVLFILVVAIYLSSYIYITNSCDTAYSLLEKSIKTYDKYSTAQADTKVLEDYWNKKEKFLSVFVNHNRIDDIEEAISLLNVYSTKENNEIFYEYADTVKMLLHQILEDTKITMHSIF